MKSAAQTLTERNAMLRPDTLAALLRARGMPVLSVDWAEDESVDHDVRVTARVGVQVCSLESGQCTVTRSEGNPDGDDFAITHYRTTRDLDVVLADLAKAMKEEIEQ